MSELHYAGHRRVCHAYALSASGAAKNRHVRLPTFGLHTTTFSSSMRATRDRTLWRYRARGEHAAQFQMEVTEAHMRRMKIANHRKTCNCGCRCAFCWAHVFR